MRRHDFTLILFAFLLAGGAAAQQAAPAPATKEDALLTAIRKGDAPAVKALIAQGVNVNYKFRYDRMSLSFACDRGNIEIVKMLLDAGAEVNAKDSFYKATAMNWALEKSHVEIAKLLLENGSAGRDGALVAAARQGSADMVKMLLALGGLKADSLSEALAAAERTQKAEIVAVLKEAGAKPFPKPDFQLGAEALAKYAGTYRSETPGAPELTFTVKEGKLVGGVAGPPPITLGAFDAVKFTVIENPGIFITFKVEGDQCTGLHLKQGSFEADYKRAETKQP